MGFSMVDRFAGRRSSGSDGNENEVDEEVFALGEEWTPAALAYFSNVQAEQALLGALLANNKAYEQVSEFLAAEHFADPLHGLIYQAISRRLEAGQLADVVTVKAEFDILETDYLVQLLTVVDGIINTGDNGRVILDTWTRRDTWMRRRESAIGETVVNNSFGAAGGGEVMRRRSDYKPPDQAVLVIYWICKPDRAEATLGCMEEVFHKIVKRHGSRRRGGGFGGKRCERLELF